MKNRWKKAVSLFFILILAAGLISCGKESTTEGDKGSENENLSSGRGAMGRYMEEDIPLPKMQKEEGVVKMQYNQEKEIELYTRNFANKTLKRYTLRAGTWEENTPKWCKNFMESLGKQEVSEIEILQGEDGKEYVKYVIYSEDTLSNYLIQIKEDETDFKDITLASWKEEKEIEAMGGMKYKPMPSNLVILKDGSIFYEDNFENTLHLYSSKSNQEEELDFEKSGFVRAFGNLLIAKNQAGDQLLFFDVEKREVVREEALENFMQGENSYTKLMIQLQPDNTLYFANSKGIHRLGAENTMWETIVEGSLTTLGMPFAYASQFLIWEGEKDEYYILLENGGKMELKHYVFDENVASVPEKQLTIYSLNDSTSLRQAISSFHHANPDVKINLIIAEGEEAGTTLSDNIRALNTELLSGNGADLLILDGLPIDSYIEKGVLMDLTEVFGDKIQNGEFMDAMLKETQKDGKLYGLPLRFQVPVAYGEKKGVQASASFSTLGQYVTNLKEKRVFGTSYQNLMRTLLTAYCGEILDENGQVSKEKLVLFLEQANLLINNAKTEEEVSGGINSSISVIGDGSTLFGKGSNSKVFDGNAFDLGTDEVAIVYEQIKNISDLMTPLAMLDAIGGDYQILNQGYLPISKVGINAASKEKELAIEFLKFLFSKEVQEINNYDGFPIHKEAFTEWVKEEQESAGIMVSSMSMVGGKKMVPLDIKWPDKKQREEFYQKIEGIQQAISPDQVVVGMILSESEKFLKGEVGAEETASSIVQKVNTYMAEQR